MAVSQASTSAVPEIRNVGPIRSAISVATGCLREIERPRSPRATFESHCAKPTGHGLSRP
jgi:hypothetical protein